MTKLLILLAAPLAACSSTPAGAEPDAQTDYGSFDATIATPPDGHRPDFTCETQPAPTVADDPLTLSGSVQTIEMMGGLQPVADADVALFRAGQPIVLSRAQSSAGGVFAVSSIPSGGHPLHAYLKATKSHYRTTFLFPQYPYATGAIPQLVPMISDALFTQVTASLNTIQHDTANGALLVVVADCNGEPLAGATIEVTHGSSPTGRIFDLGTIVPGADGTFLVLDVPDGKARVKATYGTTHFPEHDVVVRKQDPDCPTPRATLTATTMQPGQ